MVVEQRVGTSRAFQSRIVDLSEAIDPSVSGAKAAALARLSRAGFTVPKGVVIPAGVVPIAVEQPETIRTELSAALDKLGNIPVAVRSSGIAEDLDDASHAGQYQTVLNALGIDDVLAAIRTVAASAGSAQIERYRETISSGAISSDAIAILIQPMILPDSAGVAFSADPVTGNRQDVLINAVTGLGNRLMDGDAPAEEWRVRGNDAQRRSAGGEVLDPNVALAIATLARQVEATFDAPQDIEWAMQGDTLFLLQARPITALPVKPELPAPVGFWSKEVEHFTPPVSPLMYSIHRPNIREATARSFKSFGLLIESLDLDYRAGEIYERDLPLGGKDGAAPPWWVLGALSRVIPEMRERMKLARHAIRSDLVAQNLQRWDTQWKHELHETADAFKQVPLSSLSESDLAEHLDAAREFTRRAFNIHFELAVPCILPIYQLVMLCEELFGWDENQAIQLLHGSSYGSSAGTRNLDRIANLIRQDESAMELIVEPTIDLERLDQSHPVIASEIRAHLAEFGCAMIQNDPMSQTHQEMPGLTIKFLQDRVSGVADRQKRTADETRQAALEEAETLLSMRSTAERARFEFAVKRATWAYSLRDSNVYLSLLQPWALLRFALLETGERLRSAGVLNARDDVFWCIYEEVRDAIGGSPPGDLGESARRRRLEALWTIANPGPLTLGEDPGMPDFRGLPKEAREVHEAMIWALERLRAPHKLPDDEGNVVRGVPASPGRYQGTVRVIRNEQEFHRLQSGDVLVCPSTSSAWAVLFGSAGALVTDQGGSLSHPAIIAREHGIPAVVATVTGTEKFSDGQVVVVDGSAGTVEPVEAS